MVSTVYDYVDTAGNNPFLVWSKELGKIELAKLNQKIDLLEKYGNDLPPGLLSHTRQQHIYKIRINGETALRPHLCKGPLRNDTEFTLLIGANEKDRKLKPANAPEIAETRRNEIINDKARRCKHERVEWKAR